MSYLPVKGYEGLYEVSETGTIRSLDRKIIGKDGVAYPFRGKTLRAAPNKDVGYLQVSLWKDGVGISHYVHRLVAIAHLPNPKELPEVNHLDGNRQNPAKTNLEWCTSQENSVHAVDMGLKAYTNRLSKEEFVECLFSVINGESYHSVSQRVPYKVPFISVKLRKLAKELGIEGELDESLLAQRIVRARTNGAKNISTN